MRSWQHAQKTLRESLGESNYETWIKPLRVAAMGDGKVLLDAPSKFFRDWVENRHLTALRDALRDDVDASPDVTLQVKHGTQGELFEPDEKPAPSESKPTVAARLAHLVPRYTFENFVVGPSNQLAHAAARAIANNPGAVYNPVFIYGTTGVGKTHLVNAIGHAVFDEEPVGEGRLPLERSVRERADLLPAPSAHGGVQEALPQGRRADRRRRAVPRRTRAHAGRVLPHVQHAARGATADRPDLGQVSQGHPRPRGAPAQPLRVGPHGRHPGARYRDPARDRPAEGRGRRVLDLRRRRGLHRGRGREQRPRARGRADASRCARFADQQRA